MARLDINVGANANDGTGDDLRTAMQKINSNFSELYGTTAEANDLVEDGTPQLGGNLDVQNYIITTSTANGNITITPNGTGKVNLGAITINGTTFSSDDSSKITIAENLDVTGAVVLTGNLKLASGTTVNEFSTDVNLGNASPSDAKIPTQKAIKNYIDAVSVTASSITFETDDSSSGEVQVGTTLTLEGRQGITTSISGDSTQHFLRIEGPDLSPYATIAYVDNEISAITANNIRVVGDDSTGATLNSGETLRIRGTSNVTVSVADDSTTSGDSIVTVSGPDLTNYLQSGDNISTLNNDSNYITASSSNALSNKTGNISQWTNDSGYITDITLNVSADDSATIAVSNNGGLVFSGGTGISTSTSSGGSVTISRDTITNLFNVGADDSTTQNIGEGDTLVIEGGTGIATSLSGNTLTVELTAGGGVGSVGDLTVSGQQIIGTQVNTDITVTPNGVGQINLEADVIKVGDLNTNVTISSNGTGDLILKTDVDNPSVSGMGSITIEDSVDGRIEIKSGENGYVKVGNSEWATINSGSGTRNLHGFSSVSEYDRNLSAYNIERYNANSFGLKVNLQGVDPDNGTTSSYRLHHLELINNLAGKSLISKSMETFDPTSRNYGISSGESGGDYRGYAGGPVTLSVHNTFRNNNVADSYVEETANISTYMSAYHTSAQNPITINNLNGVQQSFNLTANGGTTTVGTIRSFHATGNFYTNGTATVDNYYAFHAGPASEATNNWGIYIDSADWENYLGGLTLVDNTIRADRSDDSIYLETAGAGKVVVNSILNASNVEVNNISSADSSAIQINDAVNISGVLSVDNIDINTISSTDSSAIQINDAVNISGTLSVNNIDTNTISSVDSSAVQVEDDLNISGTLTVAGDFVVSNFITNTISSNDSTAVAVNDNLDVSGTLLVNTISSADSSEIKITSALSVGGAVSTDTLDTNVITSGDSDTLQINDSVQISDNLTMGGMLTLANRTVAELNLLTPATGSMAYCTNEAGGAQPVFYDGTNWRSIRTYNVITA